MSLARATDPFADALAQIAAGDLLAYPTETVWGLGADARSEAACARLRDWKGIGKAHPVSVLVASPEAAESLGFVFSESARRLADLFWPGPLTLVLPGGEGFASAVAREDGAVGVRCSPHPVAKTLARRAAERGVGPLTATSLNRHREPPARTRVEAARLCGAGEAAPRLLADVGPDAGGGAPSTVVDATGAKLVVLRYGALGPEAIGPWLEGASRG